MEPTTTANPLKRRYTQKPKREQEKKSVGGTPSSTEKWNKPVGTPGSLRPKANRRHNPLSQSHESLVAIDPDPIVQKLSAANSVNSIVSHVNRVEEKEEVGRVASWAVSFDKLLRDKGGIAVFTEFLKKEFSEENIHFWRLCEKYKKITDSDLRKAKAKEIFNKHLSTRAPDPVNIDSVARQQADAQLDMPTSHTFDTSQNQIFQLMKQDSYARFLKSDMYKSYMMKEMEGADFDFPNDDMSDGEKSSKEENEKNSKRKAGKTKENEGEKEKRRRSILPWRQKSSKNNSKGDKQKGKDKEKEQEINNNSQKKSAAPPPPTTNIDTNVVRAESTPNLRIEPVEEVPEKDSSQPKFCRVIMPDGSTTVVCAQPGYTIHSVLGKMCDKRSLSIAGVDVFLLGSDKPLNLNEDIATLGSKEVVIERRVLFRMDLPHKKSIGVKAKPNRVIRDVFKPILNKYGYRLDQIDVHLSGHTEPLNLDGLVASIDNQRVIVLTSDGTQAWNGFHMGGQYVTATRPPLPNKLHKSGYHSNNVNMDHTLAEITNQIYGDLMQGKSESAHNFDELGILDPDKNAKEVKGGDPRSLGLFGLLKRESAGTAGAKDTGKTKPKGKVTFALQKNEKAVKQQETQQEEKKLAELLGRAQNQRLDDQRGLSARDLELPEFLRQDNSRSSNRPLSGRESAPPMLMRDSSNSVIHGRTSDNSVLIADDYVQNENENFVAYMRESLPDRLVSRTMKDDDSEARVISSFKTFGSPMDKISYTDKSFSQDGILPTSQDAEYYFQTTVPDNFDFDDPVDQSLQEIDGSNYNKYLAKSRNFINYRPRNIHKHSSSASSSDSEAPIASPDKFSPNRTLCDDSVDKIDSLDRTLTTSPVASVSPNKSGSEKENSANFSPNVNVRNIQRTSRHTVIHTNNPVAIVDGDSFLSTVDTDGKLMYHSTPKSRGTEPVFYESSPNLTETSSPQAVGVQLQATGVTFV